MIKKSTKVLWVIGLLIVILAAWYFYLFREKISFEQKVLEGRKIGISTDWDEWDTIGFCEKTTVGSRQITEIVVEKLEKKLKKAGAVVRIDNSLDQRIGMYNEVWPVDFVLAITHKHEVKDLLDESGESSLHECDTETKYEHPYLTKHLHCSLKRVLSKDFDKKTYFLV